MTKLKIALITNENGEKKIGKSSSSEWIFVLLRPVFTKQNTFLYTIDFQKIKFHEDKATNKNISSKSIIVFIEKIMIFFQMLHVAYITNTFPTNFLGVSRLNYSFGQLKRAFFYAETHHYWLTLKSKGREIKNYNWKYCKSFSNMEVTM